MSGRAPDFGIRCACFQIPAMLFTLWVALGVQLYFSEAQAPHLRDGLIPTPGWIYQR